LRARSFAWDSRARLASKYPARRVLITGATSGIGAAFAERYAGRGFDVLLHGRRRARLEEAAEMLHIRHGVRAEVVIADLSDSADIRRVENLVGSDEQIHALINNAGFTPLLPFEETTPDEIQSMIDVHVVALTRLSRAALPGMMRRRSGDIINVASDGIFARFPRSLMATYAATKAYIDTFTRGIYTDARECNVRVQALCPGFVTSEILRRHGIAFDDWGISDSVVMAAETCVDVSLAALELGEVTCVPTLEDAGLLDRMREIGDEIRRQSSESRLPATRYGVSANDTSC
jgi:short-subunit dehydrogenase